MLAHRVPLLSEISLKVLRLYALRTISEEVIFEHRMVIVVRIVVRTFIMYSSHDSQRVLNPIEGW